VKSLRAMTLSFRSLGRGARIFIGVLAAFGALADSKHERGAVTYTHDEVKEIPWSIHIAKVDRHRKDLRIVCTIGQHTNLGMSVVSDQVKALPPELGKPLAAINGDFFKNTRTNPGDPEGLEIMRGELVSAPVASRSCFWMETNGSLHVAPVTPQFAVTLPDGAAIPFGLNEERAADGVVFYTTALGTSTRATGGIEFILERQGEGAWLPLRAGSAYTARVRQVNGAGDSGITRDTAVLSVGPRAASRFSSVVAGSALRISTATQPNLSAAQEAMGGGPALVHGGTAVSFKGIQPRHPRSAIGWNDDFIFLVEVDGRQRASAGMTLPELADYMVKIGCREALNLDGGGSATLWVYGNVMNTPSEGRERPAANALVIVQDKRAPAGAPAR
jgi:hypothetical protein